MSAAFQPIAPGDGFEFDPDSVLDCNHGSCLHFKSRQGRAELVNAQRIVAVHQQVPTPLAHSHNEQLDLEIGGRLPLSENLQYPLLDILVLRRRSLRTFESADLLGTEVAPALREIGKELGLSDPFQIKPGSRPLPSSGKPDRVGSPEALAAI